MSRNKFDSKNPLTVEDMNSLLHMGDLQNSDADISLVSSKDTEIFEADGRTVKNATNAAYATNAANAINATNAAYATNIVDGGFVNTSSVYVSENINVSGTLYECGKRVYSPNNPPPKSYFYTVTLHQNPWRLYFSFTWSEVISTNEQMLTFLQKFYYGTTGSSVSILPCSGYNTVSMLDDLPIGIEGINSTEFNIYRTKGNPIRVSLTDSFRIHMIQLP